MVDNNSDRLVLYIGGLEDTVSEKILYSAFIPFGEVKSIEIPVDFATRNLNLTIRKT